MAGTVVVGASSLAYFLGKLSYILGDNCMEKFIKQVLALVEALKHVILQAPESEITVGVLRNREERQRLASEKSHNLPTFSQILEHVDMDTMSLDEQSVIVECNRVAFWKFSLPCMIASSGSTLLMFEKGFLQSRPSASYPRLPKLFLAALVGYTGGQVTYRNIMRQFLILKWKQYFVELFSSRCYMHTAKTAAEDC